MIVKDGRLKGRDFCREIQTSDWTESNKRIDLVALERDDVIAVEVKVHKWKEAFKQAFANLFAADFSYVALHHRHMHSVDLFMFQRAGIGLMEVNGTVETKLNARRSSFVIAEKRHYVRSVYLERTSNGIAAAT